MSEYLSRQRVRLTREHENVSATQSSQVLSNLRDRAEEATRDPFVWVTEYTQTWNEHWVEEGRPSPNEPFPRLPYFKAIFDIFDLERIIWVEKSRDMMLSWACVAYLTVNAMRVPSRGVLIQCQKDDKVIQLINYAKALYRNQPDWLKESFPLSKGIDRQASHSLEFAHGGYVVGIPGGADQIRSYHPYAYLNDESGFQADAGDCFNEALAAVKGKVIFNSSAAPGWFGDAKRDIVRTEED